MCRLVVRAVERGDETALANVRKITGESDYTPTDPAELCNRVLVTCYMGSENSSEETKNRAKVGKWGLTLLKFFFLFIDTRLLLFLILIPRHSNAGGRIEGVGRGGTKGRGVKRVE